MLSCYRNSRITVFLQWNPRCERWKPHESIHISIAQGSSRIYKAFPDVYVSVGEISKEWSLLNDKYDIERIDCGSAGISNDFVFDHVPYNLIHEFDQEHCSIINTNTEFHIPNIPNRNMHRSIIQLPDHIKNIVLEHAELKRLCCSISLETITRQNGIVTKCGHVFTKNSLDNWLSANTTCPECREHIR